MTNKNNCVKCNYAQKVSNDRFFYSDYDDRFNEKEWDCRNEFIRDRDRIIYSKSFRRLQHKAQVYSPGKGDHYRTRLTHTLEVTQIARGIARNLGLNEELTEAIALGHDIGHTPFGHAGEEILDDIMRGVDDLGGKIKYNVDFKGFKHNFNSLYILDCVEDKYLEEDGLNLSWQVLDGILKHTKIIKNKDGKILTWDWTRFVNDVNFYEGIIPSDYFEVDDSQINRIAEINTPLTLEGQIVNIADEIAQREHDLDDAFRDWSKFDNNKAMFNNLVEIIRLTEKSIFKGKSDEEIVKIKNSDSYKIFDDFSEKIKSNVESVGKEKSNNSSIQFYWNDCIRDIISYFKRDVTQFSLKKLNDGQNHSKIKYHKIKDNNGDYVDFEMKCFEEKLILFSDIGAEFNKHIEDFIENKLIYSYEVARFDGKGKFILRQLFKAYYENPRQMPPKKLEKLEKLIKKNYAKYGIDIKLENGESIHKIKFNSQDFSYNVNPNNVDNLVKMLKLEDNIVWGWFKNELIRKTERNNPKVEFYIIDPEKFIIIFKGTLQCILDFNFNSENLSGKFQFFVTNEEYKEVLDHVLCENLTDEILLYLKCYLENHHAYLRVICNYISEMTDNYAELEYKKLYM